MKQVSSMNNRLKKTLIVLLIAALVAGTSMAAVLAAKNNTPAEETTTEEKLSNAAQSVASTQTTPSATGDLYKEETVYVKTDAAGAVESTTVSDWLKNAGTRTQISDASSLSDIKNVKGDETFTQNPDGTLTWNTAGADIYYQGTSTQSLPVGISYVYKLNGQAMNPTDMVGKSGKVEITMNYTNNSQSNGVYTPFTVATAAFLPNDIFTDVSVDSGTVISDGNNNIVVGLAFPGLTSDLGLSGNTLDITLPEKVTITATASDFKLDPMFTCMTANIIEQAGLSTDKINSFGDLDSSINTLTSATDQLVSGALTAKNGSDTLAAGTGTLVSGVNSLKIGVSQYTDGVATAADGSSQLAQGAGTLAAGAGTLSSSVNNSLPSFSKLAQGIAAYTSGATTISNGLSAVKTGTDSLAAGLDQGKAGADSLTAGYYGTDGSDGAAAGAAQVAGGTAQVSAGVTATYDSVQTSIDTMDAEINDIKSQTSMDSLEALNVAIAGLQADRDASDDATAIKALDANIDALTSVSRSWTVLETMKQSLTGQLTQLEGLKNGAAQVAKGATALNQGINGADGDPANPSADSLYGGTKALSDGLTQMDTAVTHQAQSAQDTPGLQQAVDQLAQGSQSLIANNAQLNDGGTQLVEGGKTLSDGAAQLAQGAATLNGGLGTLNTGLSTLTGKNTELNSGVGTLVSGSTQLSDGANALASGLGELSTGMSTFKTTGIDKIAALYNNDLKGLKDRLTNIDNAGKAYTSFAGKSSEMDGSVKFIVESAEIK